MKLMLDTNTCIALIKRKPIHALQKFSEYQVGDIGISTVTLDELRYGVSKSQHQAKNQAALDAFTFPLEIAAFDEQATVAYGELRASLEKKRNTDWPARYDDRRPCVKFGRGSGDQ